MQTYASEHYYFDAEHVSRGWQEGIGSILIPVLRATEAYSLQIQEARIAKRPRLKRTAEEIRRKTGTPLSMLQVQQAETLLLYENPDLERDPKIFEVGLHPDYDIIMTGGMAGSHYLGFPTFSDFPNKLQDFTDEQITAFLKRLLVPRYELEDLRDLERRLREANPNYRIIPRIQEG